MYSENNDIYKEHLRAWRLYSKRDPRFSVYFIILSPHVSEFTLKDDILYIPGNESINQLHYKTVKALEFFNPLRYNYILRTNMSSFWYFPNLLPVLEILPREKLITGELIGDFTSGAGMILTPDICMFLVANLHILNIFHLEWAEDARISYFIHQFARVPGIQLLPHRFNFPHEFDSSIYDTIPPNTFQIRVKRYDTRLENNDALRAREPEIMIELYKRFYEKKN